MKSVRIFSASAAVVAPIIGGLVMGTLGRQTTLMFKIQGLDPSSLPAMTMFLLGHGRAWMIPMFAQAFVVLALSWWIHRADKDECWKRGALLWVVTTSLSVVILVFGSTVFAWFHHIILRLERQMWGH